MQVNRQELTRASDPQFFILVASKIQAEDGKIPAIEVIQGRLNKGFWPLGDLTRHRRSLKPGDEVVLYAAGGPSSFVATATVDSHSIELSLREKDRFEYEHDYWHAFPFGIKLVEPRFFAKHVKARELLEELSFTDASQKKWGTYFRGGAIRITESDYRLIVARSTTLPEE